MVFYICIDCHMNSDVSSSLHRVVPVPASSMPHVVQLLCEQQNIFVQYIPHVALLCEKVINVKSKLTNHTNCVLQIPPSYTIIIPLLHYHIAEIT